MTTIFDDLHLIARRPGMYLGDKRVSSLMTFTSGYRMALHGEENRRLTAKNGLPLNYLSFHLAEKYQKPAPMGWALILAEAAGSQEAGLDLFFQELEEYEAITLQRVQTLSLTPAALRHNREDPAVPRTATNGGPWRPCHSDALALWKITLSTGKELLAVESRDRPGLACIQHSSLLLRREGIDPYLKRCFGSPLVWEETEERFLTQRILTI